MNIGPADHEWPGAENPVVTIRRVRLDCDRSPTEALTAFRREPMLVGLIGEWAGSRALICARPTCHLSQGVDPFSLLDRQPPLRAAADADAVGGGWFGYIGYPGSKIEDGDLWANRPPSNRRFQLAFYDHVLRLDVDGRWWFEALCSARNGARLARCLDRARHLLGTAPVATEAYSFSSWNPTPSLRAHAVAVAACRERIARGDLLQANLSIRMESRISGDPLDAFCDGVRALGSIKSAFISKPGGAIASFSPELFLRRRKGSVESAPIKGTRAEVGAPGSIARALEMSGKDRAENVMIVDLIRNDLGRVCEYGTISVPLLARARRQAGVVNLVSAITGTLRPDAGDADLLRATFPPGSVTGAPKIAAQRVIADLESTPREAYTGTIGLASPVAGLDLSVVIRTVEFQGDAAWMGVGGGIVADSDPGAETREVEVKAGPVIAALGGHLAPAGAPKELGSPRRLHAVPTPRPDPGCGVFETMVVASGRAHDLDQHLSRLEASVRALYGLGLPARTRRDIDRASVGRRRARLRVVAEPEGGTVALTIELDHLGAPAEKPAPTSARLETVPSGIGGHKWRDRRLIESLESKHSPGVTVLIDLDGYVLEATRANVFAVIDDRLVTPPLDGRILPGTVRERVLGHGRRIGLAVDERRLHSAELREAKEIFVTSSIVRVASIAAVEDQVFDAETVLADRLWKIEMESLAQPSALRG